MNVGYSLLIMSYTPISKKNPNRVSNEEVLSEIERIIKKQKGRCKMCRDLVDKYHAGLLGLNPDAFCLDCYKIQLKNFIKIER